MIDALRQVARAYAFATGAHEGQVRKYSGVPYIIHPIRVADSVAQYPNSTPEMVMAAVLHDTVEDTLVTFDDIRSHFGDVVANYVIDLTDPVTTGLRETCAGKPRAERKAIARGYLATVREESQVIKMIDRIDNLLDMPLDPPNTYTKMYVGESRALAEVIGEASAGLKARLLAICDDHDSRLRDVVPTLVRPIESVLPRDKVTGGLDELKRINESK